jgi:hypothetical protein
MLGAVKLQIPETGFRLTNRLYLEHTNRQSRILEIHCN